MARPATESGTSPSRGWSRGRAWQVVLGTTAAYTVVGLLSVLLSVPPSYASPLFPSAGIALAATLVWGPVAAWGALLGSVAVNFSLDGARLPNAPADLLLPVTIGLGAAAQAWGGAWLLRRVNGHRLLLADPQEIARAGLVVVLACLISASVATLALRMSGVLDAPQTLQNWLTWWVGDALGTLIGAPLTLVWIGRPQRDWVDRRRTVGLPLLLSTATLGGASLTVTDLDEKRLVAAFESDAKQLAHEASSRLNKPLHALQGLHSAWLASGQLDGQQLERAARWWLTEPMELQAMGYSALVAQPAIAHFEAQARAEGLVGYRVFNREGAVPAGEPALAIRQVVPAEGNTLALGVNVLSIPATRPAVLASRDSGLPMASAGFKLTQAVNDETGVVLYQAVYHGRPETLAERQAAWAGLVFVTVRAERLLDHLADAGKAHLQWCLVDQGPQVMRTRLAGPPGCDTRPAGALERRHTLNFAGREWALRVWAEPGQLPGRGSTNAWLFSVAGMFAAAMLGALLLTVTGRAQRIELAVDERTTALRDEVAERTQAQRALHQSEARLRSILDNVPIGVVFLDPQGHIVETNPHLCAMLGETAQALLHRPLTERLPSDDHAPYEAALAKLLASEVDICELQLQLRHTNGEPVHVRARFSVLFDPQGQPLRVAGVAEDITEHLRLQASERALDRAEAASRAKSEFVSRMSHELRTPLNAMIGFAQLLGLDREPTLATHQRGWTTEIQRAGWHLLDMINDTLDLARIESGAVNLNLRTLDLRDALRASSSMLSNAAAQRGIRIQQTLDHKACSVVADETRLKQVLTNMLSNAVKYNRDGGEVHITAQRSASGGVAVTVRDSGLGMTPEQLASLFQPYNRLGREHGQIEGTGIGLVISRRLAELMGGTLEASSQAGQGSAFTLHLRTGTDQLAETSADQPGVPAAYLQRHVHYVEDNETNVEVMRGMLAQRPQVRLTVSLNGLDGLSAIRQSRPDLVLLDMQLPDISGLELLRHLKTDEELADIPVIVVSADATTARIQEALTLGAAHYVTKPVDLRRFLATLDATLDATDSRWG
jgi:PAS domain S-box-containing protein